MYAGGLLETNNGSFYMNGSSAFWTMTPSSYDAGANVYSVSSGGAILSTNVTDYAGIRPVISVESTLLVMSGNGLKNEPYILK